MARRKTERLEVLGGMQARQRADRDGNMRRARQCHARFRDRAACQLRHDGKAADIRRLALVRRHAERRVALQMFDRPEAFARGERDVVGGHVVLEIDKGFAARTRDLPERRDIESIVVCLQPGPRGRVETEFARGIGALAPALDESLRQHEGTGHRTRDRHSARQAAGKECGQAFVPDRPPAEMAGEADLRVPAVRDRKGIRREGPGSAGRFADRDRRQRLAAMRIEHLRAEENVRVSRKRLDIGGDLRPGIDHRNVHPRRAKIARRRPAVVRRGEDRDLAAGQGRVAVDVGTNRRAEHHAGRIVAAEHDGAFDGAGCEHAALGDDLPVTLTRPARRGDGQMIGHFLDRAVGSAVIDAEHSRAAQDAHIGQGIRVPPRHRPPRPRPVFRPRRDVRTEDGRRA